MSRFDLHYCVAADKYNYDYRFGAKPFVRINNPDFRTPEERKSSIARKYFVSSEECVNILISRGVEVNSLDSFGTSPLAIAAALKRNSLVIKLLEAGADPNLSKNSLSAYEVADWEVRSFFSARGFEPNEKALKLLEYEDQIVNDFKDIVEAIINPSGMVTPTQSFTNMCRFFGKTLVSVQKIEGRNNIANFKMSLIDVGVSYKDIILESIYDNVEAMGGDAEFCYDIMIMQ